MNNVRIAIRDSTDSYNIDFFDNVSGIHYHTADLQRFLAGSSSVLTLKYRTKEIDKVTAGCKLAFRYKGKDFWLSIMEVKKNGFDKELTAFSFILEANNEDKGPFSADKGMTIAEYIKKFDAESSLAIGINEVADKSIKLEWTGTDTMLARLFSVANSFGAELEFVAELNDDYSLKRHVLNIYRTGNLGKNATGLPIRVGKELKVINYSESIKNLRTVVFATGKDGLTIEGLSKKVYDNNGELLYETSGAFIRAVQSRDRFPSVGKNTTDNYALLNLGETEYETKEALYGCMLSELKKRCLPEMDFEVEGVIDGDVGDTKTLIDDVFHEPELYVQARISELTESMITGKNTNVVLSNYERKHSQIADSLLKQVEALAEAARPYTIKFSSDNGVTFKNHQGETTVVATLQKGSRDIKANWKWSVNNELLSSTDSLTISASGFEKTLTVAVAAIVGEQVVTTDQITFTNINDGAGIKKITPLYGSSEDGETTDNWSTDAQAATKSEPYVLGKFITELTDGTQIETNNFVAAVRSPEFDEVERFKQGIYKDFEEVDAQLTAQSEAHNQAVAEILAQATSTEDLAAEAKRIGEQAVADAASAITTALQSKDEAIADATAQVATVSQALNTAKADLQNQVNTVDAKAVKAQSDANALRTDVDLQAQALNTAKTDLQNQVDAVDAKAQTLTADLNNSKNDILAQATAQTALKNRVTTVETTANGTKETVTQLSKTVNDLSGEVTSATQSIKTVEDSIDGVYTTLSKITLGGINLFSLKNITNRTEVQSDGFYYVTSQLNANAEYTVSTDIPISSDGLAIVFVFSEGENPSTPVNGIYDTKPKTILTDSTGNLIVAIKSKTWFDNVVNGNNHIQIETGSNASSWQPSFVDTSAELAEYKQTIDGQLTSLSNSYQTLNGQVSQNTAKIETTADGIREDVTSLQSYVDDEGTRRTEYLTTSELKTAELITAERTKVARDYVAKSVYTTDVTSMRADINETKTSLNTISNRTKAVEDDLSGTKIQLASAESTLNTATGNIDVLNSKSATFQTAIDGINNKFDNLRLGGGNLILNSAFPSDTKNWSGTIEVGTHAAYYNGQKTLFKITTVSDEARASTNRFDVKRNTTYSLSFYTLSSSNVTSLDFFFLGRKAGETDGFTQTVALQRGRPNTASTLQYVTYTFNSGDSDNGYLRFDNNGSTDGYTANVYIAEIMLVEGNTPQAHQMADVEISDQIAEYKQNADQNYAGLQSTISTLDGKVTQNKTEANQTATQLSNRLTSVEAYKDGEATRAQSYFEASKAETAKQLTAERTAISANYVAKSTYDENVSGTTLKLNEIKTTADTTKQNLATYQDAVDRKLTELTSNTQTLDGKINTTSTKVDTVAGQIRTEISEVEAKIPTEFGGGNLIKNGGFPTDTSNWSGTIEVYKHSKYYSGTERLFLIKATGVDEVRAATNRFSVKRDTKYTLSFYALIGNNVSSADFFFLGRQNGETEGFTQTVALQRNRLPNKANLEYITYTFDSGKSDSGYIRFDNNGSTDNYNAFMFVGEVMLVEGSTARKYEKATDEVIDEISSVKAELNLTKEGLTGYFNKTDSNASSISTHTNQISALNNALSAKVSTTDYNKLTDRVASAESAISVQAGEISKRLTSTQVESAITAKGYQTKAQVDSNITGRGYITSSALQPYVTTTIFNNQVTETAKEYTRLISETQALIPTDFGGRNLAQGTSSDWSTPYTNFSGTANTAVELYKILIDDLAVGDTLKSRIVIKYTDIIPSSGQTAKISLQGSGDVTGWSSGFYATSSAKTISGSGELVFEYEFTITADHLKNGYWSWRFRTDYISSGWLKWKLAKVEKGDIFTAWSPAPEDLTTVTAFNKVSETVDEYKRLISSGGSLSNAIQSATKFEQSIASGGDIYQAIQTAKGLVTTVSGTNGLSTQVSQLAGSYAVKNLTSSGTVLNQLNLNKDGSVKIDGSLVRITGKTVIDNAVIKSAMIADGQIGTAQIGTIDGATANIININAKNISADGLSGNIIKGGTLRSTNSATNFDLVNGKLNFDTDTASVRRVTSGIPTQFVKFLESSGGALTVIGSNRDGSESADNDSFAGFKIYSSSTKEVSEIISDQIYFLTGANNRRGWQMATVTGADNKQISLFPTGDPTKSMIYASDYYIKRNGKNVALIDFINYFNTCMKHLQNHTGRTDIWNGFDI